MILKLIFLPRIDVNETLCRTAPPTTTLNRQQWDNPICRFFFYATGAEQDGTLYYQLAHVAGFFGGLFTLILLSLVNLVLLFTRAPSRGKLPKSTWRCRWRRMT